MNILLTPMLDHLLRPWRRLLTRLQDPWPVAWNPGVKPSAFGSGSIHPFQWYLTQESTVEVSSVEEVVDWLVGCRYVRDQERFGQSDLWQHPRDFERLREGDCEDHALWTWRKLIELGLDAWLFVGLWDNQVGRPAVKHAWVVYSHDGVEYLVESTLKNSASMIGIVPERRTAYCPHFSVGRDLRIRSHRGYVLACFGWRWKGDARTSKQET